MNHYEPIVPDPSPERAVDGEGASALVANEEAKAEDVRWLLHWVGREQEEGPWCTAHEPPAGQGQAKLREAQQYWED